MKRCDSARRTHTQSLFKAALGSIFADSIMAGPVFAGAVFESAVPDGSVLEGSISDARRDTLAGVVRERRWVAARRGGGRTSHTPRAHPPRHPPGCARIHARGGRTRGGANIEIDKPTSPSGSEAGTQRPGLNDDLALAKDNGCQSAARAGPHTGLHGAPAQPARKRRERARVRKTPDAPSRVRAGGRKGRHASVRGASPG